MRTGLQCAKAPNSQIIHKKVDTTAHLLEGSFEFIKPLVDGIKSSVYSFESAIHKGSEIIESLIHGFFEAGKTLIHICPQIGKMSFRVFAGSKQGKKKARRFRTQPWKGGTGKGGPYEKYARQMRSVKREKDFWREYIGVRFSVRCIFQIHPLQLFPWNVYF